ncbi:MAG: RluA family pseudouridine synthase [Spirochaetes bacterium]|nr:RluA family pseudouridine synthase [Spirochaetota bacterium]
MTTTNGTKRVQYRELRVEEESCVGMRVDRYVADELGLATRSQLKAREAEIQINGKAVKLSKTISLGDLITVRLPAPEPISLEPEDLHLDILYEDARMIAVNKPAGLVVHPGNGHPTHTLVQGILHHVDQLDERFPGEAVRPGIVHRLDKDTSGVIIVAKDPDAHEVLSQQFRERTTDKLYFAVVHGQLPAKRGEVEGSIVRDPRNRKRFTLLDEAEEAGKRSYTSYRALRRWGRYAFVALSPRTGRTHQLRVHMRYLNAPILGDPIYARRDHLYPDARLMLHAYRLRIRPPDSPESITLRAPLPEDYRRVLCSISQNPSA